MRRRRTRRPTRRQVERRPRRPVRPVARRRTGRPATVPGAGPPRPRRGGGGGGRPRRWPPDREPPASKGGGRTTGGGLGEGPRGAARAADGLVAGVMQRLAAPFGEGGTRLEAEWERGD